MCAADELKTVDKKMLEHFRKEKEGRTEELKAREESKRDKGKGRTILTPNAES